MGFTDKILASLRASGKGEFSYEKILDKLLSIAKKIEDNPNTTLEDFCKEMNTYLNGKPIDDARKDLGIATGVMIHIAGWYFNEYLKENRLAGSYGCFGVIPKNQILETREEAEKWRKKKTYQKETSNNYYNNFLNKVISVRGSNPLHVLIKKRENVKKDETIIKS